MTELLKAYLVFTTKNKEKLLEATSDYAYEEDAYFECFYDAPRDSVHIHCHAGCEIADTLHTAEELNGYQAKLDDIVEEIEYDKTLD